MNNIKLNGNVTIKNGDNNIQIDVPNHIVNNLYRGLMSMYMLNGVTSGTGNYYYLPLNLWYIHLGTGNTILTDSLTISLENEILIEPDVKNIVTEIDDLNAQYKLIYTCIWNTGVITDTINEIGLYMRLDTTRTTKFTVSGVVTPPVNLASRVAVVDGNFSSFTPNVDYPIIINWEYNISM